MNILHIIEDNKFFKIAEDTFDIPSIKNIFIRSKDFSSINLSEINVIFFHYLTNDAVNIINNNTFNNIKLVWMFWGADAFKLPKFYLTFYDNETKNHLDKFYYSKGIKDYLEHFIKKTGSFLLDRRKIVKNRLCAINKIDYIVPIVPNDYKTLINNYTISAKFYHFNYVVPKIKLDNDTDKINILLGNSASFTNNHFTAINKLSNYNVGIILPLNYGDIEYKNYLLNFLNKKNIKSNITVLDKFLPLEEYNKILSSCKIIVMPHIRQQALGNIIMGLYNKCTIYMSPNSNLYIFLIEKGFKILSIDILSDNIKELSEKDLEFNYSLASNIFSKEKQHEKIVEFLSLLSEC